LEKPDLQVLLDYAESHPLAPAILPETFPLSVRAAMALGEAAAARVRKDFPGLSAEEILEREGVRLETVDAPVARGIQVLAEYQGEPPTVRTYPARIEHTRGKLLKKAKNDLADHLEEIALAHELFHYLWQSGEELRPRASRTDSAALAQELFEQVSRERFLRTPLTQEIAALVFTKDLLGLSRLPVLP